jgi:hypothetical protein
MLGTIIGMANPFRRAPRDSAQTLHTTATQIGVSSPWADQSGLLPWAVGDIYGEEWPDTLPLSREQALEIGAVSKVRNLLTSVIADLPLVALNKEGPLDLQPTWLYRSDSDVSPHSRMAMTVDDLLFSGHALWAVARGANGQITDAIWVPRTRWTITEGNILVDGQPVDSREVIYFQVPGFSGLLNQGNKALRAAQSLEAAAARNASNPIPAAILHGTETSQLSKEEIAGLLAAWRKARKDPEGAVAYLPSSVNFETPQGTTTAESAYLEARNGMVTVVGQLTNVRAAMLDGTASIDSLTYTTKDGEKNSFYEFDLPFWTSPIEARLSMDDVVPRGQRVRFDKSQTQLNPATPTGAPVED